MVQAPRAGLVWEHQALALGRARLEGFFPLGLPGGQELGAVGKSMLVHHGRQPAVPANQQEGSKGVSGRRGCCGAAVDRRGGAYASNRVGAPNDRGTTRKLLPTTRAPSAAATAAAVVAAAAAAAAAAPLDEPSSWSAPHRSASGRTISTSCLYCQRFMGQPRACSHTERSQLVGA